MFGPIAAAAGDIDRHPKIAAVLLLTPVILAILMVIFGPKSDAPEKRAAYDQAKLECRLSGGTYEYFGTQGYHCIPAPKSNSNRQ